MSFGQTLWQLILLALLAYLAGTARVKPDKTVTRSAISLAKGVAVVAVLYAFVTETRGLQVSLSSLGLVAIGLGVWMTLLGEAWPITRAFKRTADTGVMIGTLIGASVAVIIVVPIGQAVVLVTSFLLTFLLLIKTKQRASYVLPLIALLPVSVGFVGTMTHARYTAYVLFGLTLLLELARVVRPAFNRRLARFAPELFAEREIVRPLGVSGAVAIITLLVHTDQFAALSVAAGFGIAAVSLAKAAQTLWPNKTSKPSDMGRSLAPYLAVSLAFILPTIALLTGHSIGLLTLIALGTWMAALVPLPVDRYVVAPLAASVLVFLLT